MPSLPKFSKTHEDFLQLMHIAADYDCMYLIDFYCMNLFDHSDVTHLTDDQLSSLSDAVQRDVFSHALQSGYQPGRFHQLGVSNGFIC